jgi:N-acyl-D-aspartate/D-glutamate deacylase
MKKVASTFIAIALCWSGLFFGQQASLDVLIRGGTVMDGTGSEPVVEDVGIKGDRIVFIGDSGASRATAARTIDAAGMIVSPGFIDPHTHTLDDLNTVGRNPNLPYLMQGVTTVVTGNDGGGPISPASTFDLWEKQGIGTNAALFVGEGTVRQAVMKMSDAKPTTEEMTRMKALIGEAMDGGALGMSTGLYYAPGSYTTTEEIIELAKVAASKGGVYDSHMRDESSYTIGLIGSIEETIRIGREAQIPVHISHIKALGTDVWGKSADAILAIQKARASGIEVTADQYPYVASGTSVGASLLPRWTEVGGRSELLKRIADPALRPRLIEEMEANLKRRGGANSLLIVGGRDRQLVGKRLDAIAKQRNKSPIETALEIIANGDASVASFNMKDTDIDAFMTQDWVMTGSDGSGGHPRKYGTFPRKIREYVLNRKIISMPFAIRASSSLTAETLRIPDRGRLTPGYFADVIMFDEKTIADKSTYEQPEIFAEGMKYVVVNGKVVVDNGKFNGVLAGRPVKKASK